MIGTQYFKLSSKKEAILCLTLQIKILYMNILVTGGAGFIGSHTVVSLNKAGYNAIIIDDFSNSTQSALEGIEKIIGSKPVSYIGNCADENLLDLIFLKNKIDGVIHFAASKAVGESVSNPLKYYQNNLGSTITLLKSLLKYNITNLVFSSSCTVYGQPEKLPVTENSPIQVAMSPYGNTKQICEEIISETVNSSELKAISLRYFNPIGAHKSGLIGELPIGVPANLIPFITQTAAGIRESLSVFGNDYPTADGTCVRDYIHVEDLADAHVAALNKLMNLPHKAHYDVYNIGTGNGNTVLEVINAFEKVSGQKLNYQIKPRREGDITSVYANVSKSKNELGWEAKTSLEDSIALAWAWQKNLKK